MGKLCCDICYTYKSGPFREHHEFIVCAQCLAALNGTAEFMADERTDEEIEMPEGGPTLRQPDAASGQ